MLNIAKGSKMKFVEELRKKNVIEYVLYMWQMEDLVRAFKGNYESLNKNVILPQNLAPETIAEMQLFYRSLCEQLTSQNKLEQGHLNILAELMAELNLLHQSLLTVIKDAKYIKALEENKSHIETYKDKSLAKDKGDVNILLEALYGKLVLKLKGEKISAETEMVMTEFSKILGHLNKRYNEMKNGTLDYGMN